MGNLIHEALSEDIIGAAMTVLNELKPGRDEKLYERALVIELRERGRSVSQQERFTVTFKEHEIGTLVPDLIVDGLVIVDTKAFWLRLEAVAHCPGTGRRRQDSTPLHPAGRSYDTPGSGPLCRPACRGTR